MIKLCFSLVSHTCRHLVLSIDDLIAEQLYIHRQLQSLCYDDQTWERVNLLTPDFLASPASVKMAYRQWGNGQQRGGNYAQGRPQSASWGRPRWPEPGNNFTSMRGGDNIGLGGMLNQVYSTFEGISALGTLAQMGTAMASMQGTGGIGCQSPQPATELATALQSICNKAQGNHTDTKLSTTITRLAELAGSNNDGTPPSRATPLEEEPSFKKLRAEFNALRVEQGKQCTRLQNIEATVDETGTNVKSICKWINKQSGVAASPADISVGQERDHDNDPALAPDVDESIHDAVLPLIGVGKSREDMQALCKLVKEQGQVAFKEWWLVVQRTKSVAQWRTKLLSLGAKDAMCGSGLEAATMQDVGDVLYSHLNKTGQLSMVSLQSTPAR